MMNVNSSQLFENFKSEECDLVTISLYSENFSTSNKEKDTLKSALNCKKDTNLSYSLHFDTSYSEIKQHLGPLYWDYDESVFESVRATIKNDVKHILKLQKDCEILNQMKVHMKAPVQFYQLEYDQLVIVGCLNDLLFCQKYLASCLKKQKEGLIRTREDVISEFDQETTDSDTYFGNQYNKDAMIIQEKPIKLIDTKTKEKTSLYNRPIRENLKSSYELSLNRKFVSNFMPHFDKKLEQKNHAENKSGLKDSLSSSCTELELYQFSCKACSFKCSRRNHLLKHKARHQKNNKIINCDLCNFKTIRLSQLSKHKKKHIQNIDSSHKKIEEIPADNSLVRSVNTSHDSFCTEEEKLELNLLKEKEGNQIKFEDIELKEEDLELENKISEATLDGIKNSNTNEFCCPICNFFGKPKDYKSHMDTSHPIKYCCSKCQYTTCKKVHYIRHMKCVHENKRPFVCSFCSLAFKRQDALKQHQVVHAKEIKKQGLIAKELFKCHICRKVVRSAAYLKEHCLTHSDERSFLCEICGSAFKTRSVHRNHMKVMHSKEKKPTCVTCGKTFVSKFSLNRHETQHGIRNHGMWSNMFIGPELQTTKQDTKITNHGVNS